MEPQIAKLQAALSSKRAALLAHPMYAQINSIEDFQCFMEQHIFAVWDFMSLLKALQRALTCVEVPWAPKGSPVTRRFINEIVLGEESDLDSNGKVLSHFEMYLDAMQQIGANTLPIHQLTEWLSYGKTLDEALYQLDIREETRAFVRYTFEIINSGQLHKIAALFTFGREDLIPDMFIEILREMQNQGQTNIDKLLYYLERHIEVDGGDHGPISLKMMEEICGTDLVKWQEATEVSLVALEKRYQLWDGVKAKLEA
ncbi:MAG: DUF3050 domain-containing protein [Sphingomonadales bacterium]|jgi:hypothetical protein